MGILTALLLLVLAIYVIGAVSVLVIKGPYQIALIWPLFLIALYLTYKDL